MWSASIPGSEEVFRFEPFYSFRHVPLRMRRQGFWHASRRPSGRRNDEGTEVFLSLVDLSRPSAAPRRRRADGAHHLHQSRSALAPALRQRSRRFRTRRRRAHQADRRAGQAHRYAPAAAPEACAVAADLALSLNYLSLVEGGAEALQEILRLYNFTGSAYAEKQIQGLAALTSKRHFARVVSENGVAFARGTRVRSDVRRRTVCRRRRVSVRHRARAFPGPVRRLNSFSQLVARTQQRKEAIRRWPPRAGRKVLL